MAREYKRRKADDIDAVEFFTERYNKAKQELEAMKAENAKAKLKGLIAPHNFRKMRAKNTAVRKVRVRLELAIDEHKKKQAVNISSFTKYIKGTKDCFTEQELAEFQAKFSKDPKVLMLAIEPLPDDKYRLYLMENAL